MSVCKKKKHTKNITKTKTKTKNYTLPQDFAFLCITNYSRTGRVFVHDNNLLLLLSKLKNCGVPSTASSRSFDSPQILHLGYDVVMNFQYHISIVEVRNLKYPKCIH